MLKFGISVVSFLFGKQGTLIIIYVIENILVSTYYGICSSEYLLDEAWILPNRWGFYLFFEVATILNGICFVFKNKVE